MSADTSPQSEEFEKYGKFKVVVGDVEPLYQRMLQEKLSLLKMAHSILNETSPDQRNTPDNNLGELNLPTGLFSAFGADFFTSPMSSQGLKTIYSSGLYVYYQTPLEHGSWTPEEAEEFKDSLGRLNGRENIKLYSLRANNLYTVDNPDEETRTKVSVIDRPGSGEPFIHMHLAHITDPTFGIVGTTEHKRLVLKDLNDFRTKMGKWGQFIEGSVNAIANIKKVPQGGVLTLQPPRSTLIRRG